LISNEQLHDLYYEEGLTQSEISQRFGCSPSNISKLMKKHKIPTNHFWTEHEEDFLKNNYKRLTHIEIAQILHRSRRAISMMAWRRGLKKHPRISWSFVPSKDLSYILGVILGDGYIVNKKGSYMVGLYVKDKVFAAAFVKSLNNIGLKTIMEPREDMWVVRSCNKDFCEWFGHLDLSQITSLIEENDLIIPFIRGLYDSDGSFQVTNKKYDYRSIIIYNTDKTLLESALHLLSKIGIRSILSLKRKAGKVTTRKDGVKIISKKDFYSLSVHPQKEVSNFLLKIGSNIPRKAGEKWLAQ